MGLKEELKREMRNVQKDVAKEVEKQWTLDFEGHKIEVTNSMLEEAVKVDGRIIAQNIRKSIWSHLFPYTKLKGIFESKNGRTHHVFVKIGGFVKLGITVKVDGKVLLHDTAALQFLPWSNREPVVAFIEQQYKKHGKLLTKELPDDDLLYDAHHPRLAPGLADQIYAGQVTPFYTKKLLKLFLAQTENPDEQTRKATYEKIKEEQVISYFQEFLTLFAQTEKDSARVKTEAVWLLEHAAHREVVKFALMLLGTVDCEDMKERLHMIAQHEEFTGAALFALTNGTANSTDAVWAITRNVTGWGKLEGLNFLDTAREDIRQWVLHEGIKETVPGSVAALLCADKGKLDIALHEATVEKAVFDGAGAIIAALLYEGSFQYMDDYEYAGQVLMRYTYHAKTHCRTFQQFYVLIQIRRYIEQDEQTWEARFDSNWKPHEKLAVETNIEAVAKSEQWLQEAMALLASPDTNDAAALAVARFYKADVTAVLLDKVQHNPLNLHYYEALLAEKNPEMMRQLLSVTAEFGDFSTLTMQQKTVVIILLEKLPHYEDSGLVFIADSLRAADGYLQFAALQALGEIDVTYWYGTELEQLVRHYAKEAKDKEVKAAAKQLLEAVEGHR